MKSHFTNALCGIEEDISWDNSDLDCPDLKRDFEESVESERETGRTDEEESKWTKLI
jgi:hypothetical protein